MNILLFNMNSYSEWEVKDIPNRNRHVLHELLQRDDVERVVCVDFMPFSVKRAGRIYLEDILGSGGGGSIVSRSAFDVLRKVDEKLYVFSSVRSAFFGEENLYKVLQRQLSKISFEDFVVWSYFPYFTGYFNFFDSKKKVFDTVDDWSEHENFVSEKEHLKKRYAEIDSKADVIFTVADGLRSIYTTNKNVHWISNGVDVAHFQDADCTRGLVMKQLSEIQEPIIGYVGIIQKRVDFELVRKIAMKHTDKHFAFVGPVWDDADVSMVEGLENVKFYGAVTYDELPSVIRSFSVGIIPHVVDAFTDSMNPLKMYEYMAAGIPVVTTEVAGVDQFSEFVKIGKGSDQFSDLITDVLSSDSEELKSWRVDAMKKFAWDQKVEEMVDFVK